MCFFFIKQNLIFIFYKHAFNYLNIENVLTVKYAWDTGENLKICIGYGWKVKT